MYHVYWYENGSRKSKAVSTNMQVVREFELNLANKLQRRHAGLTVKNILFGNLCEEYLNEFSYANKRISSINRDKFTIKLFHSLFPSLKFVEQYDENVINSFKAKRRQSGIMDSTINRELNTLTSLLKFAVQKRYLDNDRPGKVTRYKVDARARERVLNNEEIKLLLKNAREPYHFAILLGLYAGLRSGEACNLTWDDVDIRKGILRIRAKEGWQPKTKTSVRDVPIHSSLASKLAKLRVKSRGRYILSFPDGKRLKEGVLGHMMARLGKRLSINGLCYHILRHTFVSRLAGAGADIYAISKMLGHSNTKITEIVYTHLKSAYYQKNIEKLPTF
jgi:integrase